MTITNKNQIRKQQNFCIYITKINRIYLQIKKIYYIALGSYQNKQYYAERCNMKKFILMLIVSSLILGSSIGSFALTNNDDVTADKVIETYSLKTITKSDVPDGITPLEFASAEEANEYLAKLKENSEVENAKVKKAKKAATERQILVNNDIVALVSSPIDGSQTKACGTWGTGTSNMRASYTYYSDLHRFSTFKDVTVYLSGITIGTTWTEIAKDHDFLDSMRTLACTVEGTLNHYIFFEGIGTIYQEPRTYYQEFYV